MHLSKTYKYNDLQMYLKSKTSIILYDINAMLKNTSVQVLFFFFFSESNIIKREIQLRIINIL